MPGLTRTVLARHPVAAVLAGVLLLAIGAASAIVVVQRQAEAAVSATRLIGEVDEFNDELNRLLWEGISRDRTDPTVIAHIRTSVATFLERHHQLEEIGVAGADFHRQSTVYASSVEVMVDALDTGNRAEALVLHRAEVAPASEAVEESLDEMSAREDARAATLRRMSVVGTLAILVLAALVAWIMFSRYERARRLAHRAYHDPLTGLANRALFFDRTAHALSLARRRDELVAVALLDLDEFKLVNDSLGHGFGDSLIVAVGRRLTDHARESDTVARLGGDEFAILVEGLGSALVVEDIARRFHEAFLAPFVIEGRELRVRVTVGWAVGDATADVDELLRNADLAMYSGKRQGKDRLSIFEPSMHRELLERLELESDLRDALDNGEMLLHYQPIVSLETGEVVGVEALARWVHPTRGFVPPMTFIPIAEQAGLIVPIGRWVLIEACRQIRSWQLEYPKVPPLSVSVNVSPVQLQSPEIVTDVIFALRESGLDPTALEIEITESVIVDRTEAFAARLEELAALGVRLAIDDFGTGYSSLSQLNHLPVDTFKIDRSFLEGVLESSDRAALLRSVIEMGHSLGLVSIAEGVEEPEEGSALRGFGCTLAQGYHYSRPLPAAAVAALFEPESAPGVDPRRPAPRPSPAL